MKLWKWLNQNTAALTLVLLLLTLLTSTKPWVYFLGPDLLVTVEVAESTLPPDLLDWMQDLIRAVNRSETIREIERNRAIERAVPAKGGSIPSAGTALGELGSSPNAMRLQKMNKINKVALKLTNLTDINLESVRLKLKPRFGGGNNPFWIDIEGDYLTQKELDSFLQEIDWHQKHGVVLPPLPDIPANATLEITYYGPIGVYAYQNFPKVGVSATGLKSDVQWVVPVPEGWCATLLHYKPYFFGAFKSTLYLFLVWGTVQALVFGVRWVIKARQG